ncbi:cysteinyl-tRNA synthetase [Linnemannia schmuckeri]|uniref:Cysteinyl-tRNA synthetase n=1 Tax=Linnemannia schmuckeri TaxID=64567 RepID=A0A9P5S3B7_9FUNG|nr:cysteinyl-tRNA synthetase [Linnemannia schmuckeri]
MLPSDPRTSSSSTDPVLILTDRRPSAGSTHSALPIPPSALLSPDDHSSHPRIKHGINSNIINSNSAKERDTTSDSHSFRSFFRSSSRPPSPTPLPDMTDSSTPRALHPSSNTAPFNNNASTSAMANSGTLSSSNATLQNNITSAYFQARVADSLPIPPPQQPPLPGGKHLFPTTPPTPRGPHQPHQRTDSVRSASETPHRRTKSTDFGDMYSKRPGLPQDLVADLHTAVASPAKEAKKTIFSLFKKKSHHPSSSPTPPISTSSSSNYPPSEGAYRKHSADDPLFPLLPPSSSSLHSLATLDHETASQHYSLNSRHGSESGESQKYPPPFSIGKKSSKKNVHAVSDPIFPGYVVDLADLTGVAGIKDDPRKANWLPLSRTTGQGAEAWLAPESWDIQPSSLPPIGPLQKSLALTPEDVTSDEMEQSDYESWSYGKKKLSTEADFPPHSIYSDVNLQKRCLPTIPIFLHSRAKDIVRLNISHNQRMDLPLDFVQNCIALRELRMAYNDLDRLPANVRSIVHLQVLDVKGNRIRDLEKAHLTDARKLDTLILQCNRLESLPESYGDFEFLRVVNLSSNNFSKFPSVLCRIASLEDLDLSFNDIPEIPDDISKLVRLRRLLLYGNRIGPFLPKSMESLSRLRKLDIRQNGILNLDALNDMKSLEELLVDYNTNVVANNSFEVLVKASIVKCNMTDLHLRGTGNTLTFLDVSSNKLSNLTSTLFDHLRSLETLKLDNNSISSIPSTVGSLKFLRTLSLANNNISSLPDEIAQLESLIVLDVHGNSLGELPPSIWHCSLHSLNASSNLLGSFPDPPVEASARLVNTSVMSASSSAATLCETDLQGSMTVKLSGAPAHLANSLSSAHSKPLPAPPSLSQGTPSHHRSTSGPPLATTLQILRLGDNRLPDDVFYPLSQFLSLKNLNLSHNFIADIPRGKIPNPGNLQELYLSGNQLTTLPADDIESLRNLRVLHVGGNKLTTLPAELGKINRLLVLDVGCNQLKYNIANWPYDWNWNWNLELKYLNMSGNKRLQIKRQAQEIVPTSTRPGNLSEFGNLTCLRILGLMDVTITDNVPDDTVERRVRTSTSTLHNMSYGMADTLGDGDCLCIWDLVHPKFQTKEDEVLFGLFDGRSGRSKSTCQMTSYLKDRFGACFKIELEELENSDTVVSALRRTFLGLDRELYPLSLDEEGRGGASALIAYIKGFTLYSANVGDAIAVLVKKSDSFQVISQKHIPWNPTEAARIKRSGGFVSEKGLLNDELDISRSFGQYHLVPIVNSNPYIETTTLTEDDDFLIMASKSFWDVMSYATAVDIAKAGMRVFGDPMIASQKLRDIAISYGAQEHMVVMLIGVGDLFKKKELTQEGSEYPQHKKRPKAMEGPVDALKYLKPEIEPPQGDVAMVFTSIKNSTQLWEDNPVSMAVATKEHFNIMRRQLRSIGGYEVKIEGEAMMASFSSVPAAVLWCIKVQELLVQADWPQDILDSVDCKPIHSAADPNQLIYRGLSVRMGIHWGQPVSHRDEVTRRMDYYGSMVNRSARICASADGGEICVSSDVVNVIQQLLVDPYLENSDSPYAEHIREMKKMGFGVLDIGEKKLKGLETPESLHLLYTRMLAGRFAVDSLAVAAAPNAAVQQEIVETTMVLDVASIRLLQSICLRLERLVSGAGRATEQMLALLSLPIRDNADQDDLVRIADNCISRIENCFSQLYMAKSGQFVQVYESLSKALSNDPNYILQALQMYVNIVGGLDTPALL